SSSARMSSASAVKAEREKSAGSIASQPRPRARAAASAASISASCAGDRRRCQRGDCAMSRPCQTQAPPIGLISRMARPPLAAGHSLAAEKHKAKPGQQQQSEHDAAEPGLVEIAEAFQAGPGAESEKRQADQEQAERVGADQADAAEIEPGHQEHRDAGWLKYGALLGR